jgi:hypothetical protein
MSKYYESGNKVVYDGDTASAADLNNINLAVNSGLEQVQLDIESIGNEAVNATKESEAWATSPVGVNPSSIKPDKYSSEANATEAELWASSGVTVIDASGIDTGEKSAKTHSGEAIISANQSEASRVGAETAKVVASTKASEAEASAISASDSAASVNLKKFCNI